MKKFFFTTTFIFISFSLFSQDFQGQAFYKTKTNMDFGSWGDKMTTEQKNMMKERMKPFLEPVFILTFDKIKSIYKEEESLGAPGGSGGRGWSRMMMSNGGPIYKNIKSDKHLQSTEFMGKKFLISQKANEINWLMENDQKMIGNYLCFKATAMIEKPKTITSAWSNNEKKNIVNDSIQNSEINQNYKEFTTVTAWYTPQIPVSHGPAEYGGLPGLILEISTENSVILCTKVVMNPEKKIEILEPSKGELVSKIEFENIVEVKVNEMRDMWSGQRGKSRRKN